MNRTENKTFKEVFELFTKSRIARGVSDTTIRNYYQYLRLQSLLRLLAVVLVGLLLL